jgi:lipid II:glycine glycyltransferase (peptidoglycan interpeptide bridge formation enzyme)
MIDKENFNKISTHPLQTWEWGEFRKKWGNEVVRFPFGQITVHKLPLLPFKIGVFVKGPKPDEKQINTLKEYAKTNNIFFVKLEPNYVPENDDKKNNLEKLLKKLGCIKGKRLFTPETFWIDLTKSEEELLKSFSQKTRYNIKLAEKRGVKVYEDNSEKAFNNYLKLTFETARRQGFFAHTKKYHQLMWKTLKDSGVTHLMVASYKKEILTTWILFTWKDFLYYPYGASSDKYRNLMANNLMMWEAIRFGKKQNLKTFDLWGKEEGKGFTKFKEGYNPKVVNFIGTWDLVINKPIYYLYRFIENIRWFILRHFPFIKSHG